MKTQRKQTKTDETKPRRVKRTRAHDELTAFGTSYLRAATSGSYDDDDGRGADLRGFHFFGLS